MAQFTDIAVTDDGGQIYFTFLPLRGETGGGIFRWTGERFERFVGEAPVDPDESRTAGFTILRRRPMLSGGGGLVAWTDEHRCYGYASCAANPIFWTLSLTGAGSQPIVLDGRIQISRNGRYVASANELRDLSSGSVSRFPLSVTSDAQSITSDGRVLGYDGASMLLWSQAASRVISTRFRTGVISDNGRYIVAVGEFLGEGERLVALNVDSGAQVELGTGTSPSISNDGLQVLFLSGRPAQLYLASTITAERRRITDAPEGILAEVLAGFGRTAIAATNNGRLLRIDVNTGTAVDLIPRTPLLSAPSVVAPCDAIRFKAYGVPEGETLRLTLDAGFPGAGWRSRLGRGAAPDSRSSSTTARLEIDNNSPFDSSWPLTIRRIYPVSVSEPSHQDFSGLIDLHSPAKRGEIIHAWGTGFGAVDQPRRTGEPAPISPPAKLVEPVNCVQWPTSAPIEVMFAGARTRAHRDLSIGHAGSFGTDGPFRRTEPPHRHLPIPGSTVADQCAGRRARVATARAGTRGSRPASRDSLRRARADSSQEPSRFS